MSQEQPITLDDVVVAPHIHRWRELAEDHWHECVVCGLNCRDADRAYYEMALRDVKAVIGELP